MHQRPSQASTDGVCDLLPPVSTHLSLAMDCPETCPVEAPEAGKVIAVPEIGGLHHHYERRTA